MARVKVESFQKKSFNICFVITHCCEIVESYHIRRPQSGEYVAILDDGLLAEFLPESFFVTNLCFFFPLLVPQIVSIVIENLPISDSTG